MNVLNYVRRNHTSGGLLVLVITIAFYFCLCICARYTWAASVAISYRNYYLLMILFAFAAYFASKNWKLFAVVVVLQFVFFGWLTFSDVIYSNADESGHFDLINHIVSHNSLQTFKENKDFIYLNAANDSVNEITEDVNHEAVQAPFYYMVMALFGKLVKNAYARLHLFRLLSLFFILIVFCFVHKTIKLLSNHGFFIDEDIYRISLLLTVFSPGCMLRASRVNNETMTCVLISILVYVAVRCLIYGFSIKSYWLMAFLSALCFLTKVTTVYVYLVIAIAAIMQKRIKEVILPGIASSLIILPWFAFNLLEYGHLTAMKEHLDIVLPIENPNHVPVNIVDSFFSVFTDSYYSGQETVFSLGELLWIQALFVLALFGFIHISYHTFKKMVDNHFQSIDLKTQLNCIGTMLILACFATLTAGTISSRINALRGRYFYALNILIIMLIVLNIKPKSKSTIRKYAYLLCIIVLGIVNTKVSTSMIDRVYASNHVYASRVNSLELRDVTNDKWTHGYANRGNYLLIGVNDKNCTCNYKALEGHIVSNGTSEAIVTEVSDMDTDSHGSRYVLIKTDKHIDTGTCKNNRLYIGKYCRHLNYNTVPFLANLGDIEGKEAVQQLKIKDDGTVYGCDINFGIYGETNFEVLIQCKVSNDSGEVIEEFSVKENIIEDNEYLSIYFEKPIKVKRDQIISIGLRCNNAEDLPISINATKNNFYKDGQLRIDGEKVKKKDMRFKLIFVGEK